MGGKRARITMMKKSLILALLLLLHTSCLYSADNLKMAVLKFGTVNWELDVIKRHGLDRQQGFNLEVLEMAGKQATMVALQAGSVDIAVSDWIWVSRQRNEGKPFTFVPYSTALGALVVPQDSTITQIKDLQGLRLGIAGGPLDKSWLLLQALAFQQSGLELNKEITPVFAAPPLLNQQLKQKRIEAVLNFWPYVARLEAIGMRQLISVQDISRGLGIRNQVPFVGYVFDEQWAKKNKPLIQGFVRATSKAKQIMLNSDQEWEQLRPLMKASDEATFLALREGFRAGIPSQWGAAEQNDAKQLFDILFKLGGKKLVGNTTQLAEGTFWPNSVE
ncbi:MAG: ABC transporter substrate-binding protein [gamma proteobacterium symbiont of Stewartia floridana]|nr:MAG: ABC transporter substrate-binding protein [gamma proteobacterium symbiont of Stewartia floridana]RLW57776.1 MAG: ABC transporter substrate-binding protein [gamma proteobacterium symbiont of Stewartia floridana]RLW63359.1 MAG: ABC transporter substrate-binding protein [gamma proteobacterium symbiont of Stewartia floridana]RLW65916.1 MAG: ABC transporter substrate-binding protein [gamma proteobacterium symbiont of Stewartia floridana]RLW70684.1 MAG: ABC transporter substrate-binding prote